MLSNRLPSLATSGERLRWARRLAGLNQDDVAKLLGYDSRKRAWELEANRRPLTWEHAKRLEEPLHVPAEWLMGDDVLPSVEPEPVARSTVPAGLSPGKWIVDLGLHERVLSCSSWQDLKGLLPAWVTPLQTCLALPISDRTAMVDWAEARALQAQVDAHVAALIDLPPLIARGVG